jgi:hypothetical protein
MATSAVTLTAKRSKMGAVLAVTGIATVGAGDYAAGGLALDLSLVSGITNRKPDFVAVHGNAGYQYEYIKSTGKIQIRQDAGSNTVFAELAASATPSAVTGDVITLLALWFATPGLPVI